ncbi:MAG: hypothetical protein F6K35_38110, partial [Okeania sp. SIO2H7]|nr:hypothetical protein [Okeania sp. SIO2H7]
MSWMDFLRMMADKYSLSAEQTEVFLSRFNEDNQNKPEKEIRDDFKKSLGIDLDVERYRKRMRNIYAKFAKNKQNPTGCLELNDKGPHKCKKLLDWLQKQYGKPELLE